MKMKIIISLALLFLFFNAAISFEYFVMVYQWPPAFCQEGQCNPGAVVNNFKIRGLWPAITNATDPAYCREIPLLEQSKVSFLFLSRIIDCSLFFIFLLFCRINILIFKLTVLISLSNIRSKI